MSATDETLFEVMVRVENKDIFVDLKKNRGGVYLKISERGTTGRNTVLIPASGIPRLKAVLDDVAKASSKAKSVSRERKNRVAGDPEITARSIYVTGLTWDTTDEELLQHFAPMGDVINAVILRQRRGGNAKSSMGCGVVEFGSREGALQAVTQYNETELKGRKIRCREDRNPNDDVEDEVDAPGQAPKAPRVKKTKPTDESRPAEPNKVFVTSLTWDTTEESLTEFFSQCGQVASSEILSTKKGRSMGSGIVEFATPEGAAAAIAQLSNQDFNGRKISVRQYFV